GNGDRILRLRKKEILDEIVGIRDPWRGEHLGGYFRDFSVINKGMVVHSSIDSAWESLDEDTMMENRVPGINLEDWIRNPTKQGLPRNDVKSGTLWYWCPRDKTVAWFGADSGRADFGCNDDPSGSVASLGVRVARFKE
ncbi:MAG: hypothetical protein AABY07_02730, partial [Nanoarchaeota archaeon]